MRTRPRQPTSRSAALRDDVPNYGTAERSNRHSLAMISPPARNFLNSTPVNVHPLPDIEGEPLPAMHADHAAARRIGDRQVVDPLTSQRLADPCRGSVFHDCPVGVRPA